MSRFGLAVSAVAVLATLYGCAAGPGFSARMELGEAHYRRAREALDAANEDAYVRDIGLAQREFVEAARLRPESAAPHVWMGIVLVYQSDIEAAIESFRNARNLEPDRPVHYTNLAQALVYRGDVAGAQRLLHQAERRGAPRAWIELTRVLAAWRASNLTEARDRFALVQALDPEFVQTWDEAPIFAPIESFDDFAGYCCASPSCGPYMQAPCREVERQWRRGELQLETLRRQMEQERERRRRLKEIYADRQDLRIEIDAPASPAD